MSGDFIDLADTSPLSTNGDVAILSAEYASYSQRFILHPTSLNDCQLPCAISWDSVPFEEKSYSQVSEKQGVYAFAFKSKNILLPPHSYILYIGKTDRALRTRFREYILDQKEERPKRRPHVWDFVVKWKDSLCFYFAEINDQKPEDIERILLDSVIPPRSVRGFSAHVSAAKEIWRNS